MTIEYPTLQDTCTDLMKPITQLKAGEKPITNALPVQLGNGEQCIPQHYLLFTHSRKSVEQIVLDIDYDENFLIFVCEDYTGIYIQIGIIGFDNFLPLNSQKGQKIVYGRKWRVEPQLPTSEIIQTVFLALKSAREHEIRELFRLTCNNRIATPFNNHHDLPLMAQNSELVFVDTEQALTRDDLQKALNCVRYDFSKLLLTSLSQLKNKQWLLELKIENGKTSRLPETKNATLNLLLMTLTINELYFQIMDGLLSMSNRQVEENFYYLGFARFSRNNSIEAIARLSSTLRKSDNQSEQADFIQDFDKATYQTDTSRVPALHRGQLTNKIRSKLAEFNRLQGILPI